MLRLTPFGSKTANHGAIARPCGRCHAARGVSVPVVVELLAVLRRPRKRLRVCLFTLGAQGVALARAAHRLASVPSAAF